MQNTQRTHLDLCLQCRPCQNCSVALCSSWKFHNLVRFFLALFFPFYMLLKFFIASKPQSLFLVCKLCVTKPPKADWGRLALGHEQSCFAWWMELKITHLGYKITHLGYKNLILLLWSAGCRTLQCECLLLVAVLATLVGVTQNFG